MIEGELSPGVTDEITRTVQALAEMHRNRQPRAAAEVVAHDLQVLIQEFNKKYFGARNRSQSAVSPAIVQLVREVWNISRHGNGSKEPIPIVGQKRPAPVPTKEALTRPSLLPNKHIPMVDQFRRTHTSGGDMCVPNSTVMLRIIQGNITAVSDQEKLHQSVISNFNRIRRAHNAVWVTAGDLVDEYSGEFVGSQIVKDTRFNTGLDKLDALLTILMVDAQSTSSIYNRRSDLHIQRARKDGGLAVFLTEVPLRSTVVDVNKDHPYWPILKRMKPNFAVPPAVGSRYYTAGDHAMLAVDYLTKPNGTYDIFMLDPQTGCILKANTAEIIEDCKKSSSWNVEARRAIMLNVGTAVV